MMKALITGASSGIGFEMAKYLGNLGYGVIAVGRNEERLEALKAAVPSTRTISMDLSAEEHCISLYESLRGEEIGIVINNAGFGLYGEFADTSLDTEVKMIGTNITALHILTKLFYRDMLKRDSGYIMNVASVAGFMPGPLMSTYYATKAYVARLTQAIREEAAARKSKVRLSLLCPGPVKTRFDEVAGIQMGLTSLSAEYVAKYAVNRMLKGKFMIVPGAGIKAAMVFAKLFPDSLTAKGAMLMQGRKRKA